MSLGRKMKLLKHTKGIVDKIVGARKRSAMDKDGELLDPMQKYTTIGEYHVDAEDGTPDGKKFVLTVYQDKDGRPGGVKVVPPLIVHGADNEYTPAVQELLYGK